MSKNIFALSLLFIATAFGSLVAMATPPQAPNLEVRQWVGSSTPLVESAYQYTTTVKNIGYQTAQGVIITVEFPLTNTSPGKYILGKLTAVSAPSGPCSTANNKIVCNIGNISATQTKTVNFTF